MRVIAALAALLVLGAAGCGGNGGDGGDHDAPNLGARAGAEEIRCRVGEKPRYFVPGPPAVIAGCVRLGISGKALELSVQAETLPPISGGPFDIVCVNPAFPSRGPKAGLFIPEVCRSDPVSRRGRIDIKSLGRGFEAYELVLVGVLPGSGFDRAAVSFGGDDGVAVISVDVPVFEVGRALADRIGANRPFSVLAAELPTAVACEPVIIEAQGPEPVSVTEPVKPQRCENLTDER